ncbi:glutathione peroxidase [Niabella digestorum]|jgi:Glutathione peroxidase|uniref:Glutathione peroxidase n=1 Tax=Niabella digestorum TaxID=3117701 RepID=A0ABU7RGY4_9BACT
MKTVLVCLLLAGTLFIARSIYDFKVDGLTGGTINFADFKGKKILIVNTASKCGLTPQYEELELLYKKHKDKLVVVGFPANNFREQEPGTNEEIAEFCKKNYGVTFPMAAKISVKGNDIAPIYKYLIEEAKKKKLENPVTWNFGKFLINEKGELIATFSPRTKPMSKDILKYLN